MNISGATPPVPFDSSASNALKPATGFWALFFDPQHPEAAPNPKALATGATGFEALFGNTTVTPPSSSANPTVNTGDVTDNPFNPASNTANNLAGDVANKAASQLIEQYGPFAQNRFMNAPEIDMEKRI